MGFNRPSHTRSLLLAGAALLAGCREPDGVDGTVIVVVMDGVRVEESFGDDPSSANGEQPCEFMPTLWSELMPQGVRAPQAWSLGATTTSPAHVAITSGRRQAFANYAVDDDVGLYQPELPSVFDEVRQQLGVGEGAVSLIMNSDQVRPIAMDLWPDSEDVTALWVPDPQHADKPCTDDSQVLRTLQTRLLTTPTRFALVNLHQVDRSGHYGTAVAYLKDVRDLDAPLVGFWTWLQEQPNYRDDTWLVILSDHGRHDLDVDGADPLWRNHGCSCNGCRHVPLLVLGPGVAAGQDVAEPVLLADLAPTLAARLGVRLPWADGLVRDDLFEEPSGLSSRAGLADFAVAGELTAEVRYLDDPAHRSALWLAGQRLSDPAAIAVEAPALAADGAQAWTCFREVILTPEEPETTWRARCFASDDSGATWDELPAPHAAVGPYWQPLMTSDGDGGLLAAWVANLHGSSTSGVEGGEAEVTLEVARYADGAWAIAADPGIQSFPTDPTMVASADRILVAAGSGFTGAQARHTRDVYVGRATLSPEGLAWQGIEPTELAALATTGSHWRLERPALRLDGPQATLAAIGHDEAGAHAVLALSADSGATFTDAHLVDLAHDLDPHVSPVWLGDTAVWVAVDPPSDATWLCAAGLEGAARCTATDAARVQRLQADGDTLWALADPGDGTWELERWGAGEL